MAPTSIDGGDDFDYELPVVFAEPSGTDLDPPQYYYIKGAGFNEDAFGQLAPAVVAGYTWDYQGWGPTVDFTNTSQFANSYVWDFDDGGASNFVNPSHNYTMDDTYNVCLTASNAGGSDVFCDQVTVQKVGIEDVILENALDVFPNPTNDVVNIAVRSNSFDEMTVGIYNLLGELMIQAVDVNINATNSIQMDVSNLASGNYMVKVQSGNAVVARAITVQ